MSEASGHAESSADTRYRPDIDGLRAIAVTAVVLYHIGLPAMASGFVGVDIFFVISGYLIGGIILREAGAGAFRFVTFYARRARRILPALFAVVLFTCVAGWFLLKAEALKSLGTSAVSALLAISNFKFATKTGYFTPDAHNDPLLMTWSLGVEEQFYVLFPFLLLLIAKLRASRRLLALAALIAVSFAASLLMLQTDPRSAFYLLPSRAWELGIGALLAALHQRPKAAPPRWRVEAQSGLGLVLLAASITLFSTHVPFPGWAALVPVLGAALLIDSEGAFINRRLLSAPPMRFVGLISYSWYLWHWPLLTYVRVASSWKPSLEIMLAVGALSFVIAILSWRWIEQPFRHRTLKAPQVLVRYALAGAVALALPLSFRVAQGWPDRLPAAARAAEAVANEDHWSCLVNFEDTALNDDPDCLPPTQGAPAFALIGDSHASALAPALRQLAEDQGARLLQFTKSACSPLLGVTFRIHDRPQHGGECVTYLERATARIAADPDIRVVFVVALWQQGSWGDDYFLDPAQRRIEPDAALRAGLPPMLRFLRAHGKEVVVVGDVPNFDFSTVDNVISEAMPLRRWVSHATGGAAGIRDGFVAADRITPRTARLNDLVRTLAQGEDGVGYVDLTSRFCVPSGCRFERDGQLLYFDDAHLSQAGAAYALAPLRELLARHAGGATPIAWSALR
jgi:peptidoglycan/LPS O-acetylase OafA/YrhL